MTIRMAVKDNGNNMSDVHVQCTCCAMFVTLTVTTASIEEYLQPNRPFVQKIWPDMPASLQEMFVSGTCPKCWDEMFAGLDEDV